MTNLISCAHNAPTVSLTVSDYCERYEPFRLSKNQIILEEELRQSEKYGDFMDRYIDYHATNQMRFKSGCEDEE